MNNYIYGRYCFIPRERFAKRLFNKMLYLNGIKQSNAEWLLFEVWYHCCEFRRWMIKSIHRANSPCM